MSEAKEKQQHQQKSHKDKGAKPSAEEIAAKKAAKKAKAQIADEGADEGPSIPAPPPRLIEHYKTKVVPALQQRFGYRNTLAIPRVKDFRGLPPTAFDKAGNYNFGFNEQTVFPEVDSAAVTFQQGMNITMVTTARSADEGRELLKQFGFPFREPEVKEAK